jgi:hypothetical protein
MVLAIGVQGLELRFNAFALVFSSANEVYPRLSGTLGELLQGRLAYAAWGAEEDGNKASEQFRGNAGIRFADGLERNHVELFYYIYEMLTSGVALGGAVAYRNQTV